MKLYLLFKCDVLCVILMLTVLFFCTSGVYLLVVVML